MSGELHREVAKVVAATQTRSGWPVTKILPGLGVSTSSYYRWLRQQGNQGLDQSIPLKPVQPYEALLEERQVFRAYALKYPEIRHRELAWKMLDQGVACLSPSTVYRILLEEELVCPWNRRKKRGRKEVEKASKPNEVWGTDLMYLRIGTRRNYFLVLFLDEYSRYLVHHELLAANKGSG